jgi:hypothetical protein
LGGEEPLYFPTDVQPKQIFQAIGRLRKEARDEVDRLIRFLDKTDDYVSRELEVSEGDDEPDGGEEPSLGSADRMVDQTKAWVGGSTDPRTVDREKDDCDDEPSLGSVAVGGHRSQEEWTEGNTDDRKDEHEGAEPDEDGEPLSAPWTGRPIRASLGVAKRFVLLPHRGSHFREPAWRHSKAWGCAPSDQPSAVYPSKLTASMRSEPPVLGRNISYSAPLGSRTKG